MGFYLKCLPLRVSTPPELNLLGPLTPGLHPVPTTEWALASPAASLPEAGLAVHTRCSVAHLAMDTSLELWIQDEHLEAGVAVTGSVWAPGCSKPTG